MDLTALRDALELQLQRNAAAEQRLQEAEEKLEEAQPLVESETEATEL